MTDNEVASAISSTARDKTKPGHHWAKRLASREHYRALYSRIPQDVERTPDAVVNLEQAAASRFGSKNIRYIRRFDQGGELDFPVLMDDGKVVSSIATSEVLRQIPGIIKEYLYINEEVRKDGEAWKDDNLDKIFDVETKDKEES